MAITITEQEKAEILSKCKTQSQIDWVSFCFGNPIEEIRLAYHWKRATAKYPNQIIVYYGDAISHYSKKNNSTPLISRPATRDECINDHFRHRMHFSIYKDWDKLVEDEILCLLDNMTPQNRKFINELRILSKKHPL